MYRRQGSLGVLQGVLSGPYTGGKKRVDAGKLGKATRQRLADVLAGRAEPSPILYSGRLWGLAARVRPAWGLVVGLVALAIVIAIGFGDPSSALAYQPASWLALYGAASLLLVGSLLVLGQRRALGAGGALVPGRYLLPLDVIDVPPADREGRQVLTVLPLGDARDARVKTTGGRSELTILYEGGVEMTFPVRTDREGDAAMRRLEASQRILEELTYGRDLEKTVALDPLFDIRVDASWAGVAPAFDGERTPASVARRLLRGPAALVGALAVSGAVSVLAFGARNRLSDRALFIRAITLATPEAYDVYLERGTGHREAAQGLRDRLLRLREEAEKRAAATKSNDPFGPPRSESDLTPGEREARAGTADACIAALRARAPASHPEALPILESLVKRAQRSGDNIVPVVFQSKIAPAPPEVGPGVEASLRARETRTLWALERIFSETCPAALVRFAPPRPEAIGWGRPDPSDGYEPANPTFVSGLRVRYDVTWTKSVNAPQSPRIDDGSPFRVRPLQIVFHIELVGVDGGAPLRLDLTLPPPQKLSMHVRDRSLFAIAGAPAPEGTFDDRVYEVLTARAFDRLYDELYGLVFEGNPRVPLREANDGAND